MAGGIVGGRVLDGLRRRQVRVGDLRTGATAAGQLSSCTSPLVPAVTQPYDLIRASRRVLARPCPHARARCAGQGRPASTAAAARRAAGAGRLRRAPTSTELDLRSTRQALAGADASSSSDTCHHIYVTGGAPDI